MSFVGQVLHVFRQDVGRFWPALLGVGALMAVHWTMGLPVPSGYAPPFAGPIPVFPLIFMLFTVILIQDHRVAGDTDFWATRPLEALAILAGKAVFIGFFFCLVPVVVHVQWLLETAGGGDTRALLASSMLHQSGLLALVAAGAAATSGVGAFVALAVPVWLGTGALVGLLEPTFDFFPEQWMIKARAELPLEVGASTSLDAGTVEVDRVQREDGAVMVSLAYRLAVAYPSHPVELQLRHPAYAAILSRAYHGYVPFLSGGGGSRPRDRIPVRHFVGGASLHQEIVETAVSLEDAAGGGPPLPADWLDEAVLLLTESVYEGSFQRSFTLALDSLPASNRSLSIPPAAGSGGDG